MSEYQHYEFWAIDRLLEECGPVEDVGTRGPIVPHLGQGAST